MNNGHPSQGDVWLFDPDPIKGTEIGKKIRPGIVISHDLLNKGHSGLILIVPLTSVRKGIPSHVQIDPPEGGVGVTSYALCEQIRSISKIRLVKKMGKIRSHSILKEIRSWILDLTFLED
jgi:mRNA interferase MazF